MDLEGETTKRDGVNLGQTTSLFLVQVDCPQAHFSNHRILLKRNSGDSRRCSAPDYERHDTPARVAVAYTRRVYIGLVQLLQCFTRIRGQIAHARANTMWTGKK